MLLGAQRAIGLKPRASPRARGRREELLLRLDLRLHVEELIVLCLEVLGNIAGADAGNRLGGRVGKPDGVAAENQVVMIAADNDAALGVGAVVQDAVVLEDVAVRAHWLGL